MLTERFLLKIKGLKEPKGRVLRSPLYFASLKNFGLMRNSNPRTPVSQTSENPDRNLGQVAIVTNLRNAYRKQPLL